MKIKNAFTLAETLITLMVIGVVAVLTIPNLIQAYKERVTITKVKQAHSILNQAYKMAIQEYGEYSTWTYTGRRNITNLAPYLKIRKDCTGKRDCAPKNYTTFLGEKDSYSPSAWFCNHNGNFNADNPCMGNAFFLDNGMIVYSNNWTIFVDIDGEGGKNRLGYDLFSFKIQEHQIYGHDVETDGNCIIRGYLATLWILKKNNMNYLHKSNINWKNELK